MERLRERTGIAIPTFFPEGVDYATAITLVRDTVAACAALVADPARVVAVIDAESPGRADLAQHCAARGATLHVLPVNRGKLQSVREAAAILLARRDVDCLCAVDQDGDHFPNEIANLVRALDHISGETGSARVMVLGHRRSLHRPMGYLRGELEEFVDRILLDALHYHAVRSGVPLRLEYATMLDEVPDFHSGFKLFSRTSAEDVFLSEPQRAGLDEIAYSRHGVEAVMTVESMVRGAVLGLVGRSTFNDQPVSTFGLMNRGRLFADMILWPCRRLDVPADFVIQWMRNHAARLVLNTLAPQGREEVERIVALVLEAYGSPLKASEVLAGEPLFV